MSETPRTGSERDAKLAALYRAAVQEEPPPALDDALRAAARREVGARPRHVGSSYIRSWRVPLSIAAVILLSVSLITLIRDEAPEVAQPPLAGSPADTERKPAAADQGKAAESRILVPDEQRSKSIGLKPPKQTSAPGMGVRGNSVSPEPAAPPRTGRAAVEQAETGALSAPSPRAKRASPEAFPGAADIRDNKIVAPGEHASRPAKENARRDAAAAPAEARQQSQAGAPTIAAAPAPGVASGEGKARLRSEVASADSPVRESSPAPAPAAKPPAPVSQTAGSIQAYVNLTPEKWLERIEELRKQGRLEEARTNLAEFRKRYPDYQLPESLKDGIKP
jgi:hypothetical protein